jgi:hypothetical protein
VSGTSDPVEVEVPQRLVQAVSRMAFLDEETPVRVEHAGRIGPGAWIGLAAATGTAWWRPRLPLTIKS